MGNPANLFLRLLFFVLLTYGCSGKLDQAEIMKFHLKLKTSPIEQFDGWHIYPYHGLICFTIFHEHGDSSKFAINDQGDTLGMSKYSRTGFYIKDEGLDSLYAVAGEMKYHSFNKGTEILSGITGVSTDSLQKLIPKIYKLYTELEIPEIVSFPWIKATAFQLDPYSEIIKVNSSFTKDQIHQELVENEKFILIGNNWYYKTSDNATAYGDQ